MGPRGAKHAWHLRADGPAQAGTERALGEALARALMIGRDDAATNRDTPAPCLATCPTFAPAPGGPTIPTKQGPRLPIF